MIDFTKLTGIEHGGKVVTQIEDSAGRVLWAVKKGTKVVLDVTKQTLDTVSGGTSYTGEHFAAVNVYPRTNGTVKVTYGGVTKTISDTSGVAEPNVQTVYFGTIYGVTDDVETPESGTLTIEGNFSAFGEGQYEKTGKAYAEVGYCGCINRVDEWGDVETLPDGAFSGSRIDITTPPSQIKSIGARAFQFCDALTSFVVPEGIDEIKDYTFYACCSLSQLTLPSTLKKIGQYVAFVPNGLGVPMVVNVLATTPPEYTGTLEEEGAGMSLLYGMSDSDGTYYITVPKGCLAAYQSAPGWSAYAEIHQTNKVIMKEVGT